MQIQQYETPKHALVMMETVVNELDKIVPGRYSSNLVNQLVYTPYQGMSCIHQFIIPEIAHLENSEVPTRTIKEGSFNRPDMQGLWKKHFTLPQFRPQNIQDYWKLGSKKSKKFESAFNKKYEQYLISPTEDKAHKLSSYIAQTLVKENEKKPQKGEYIIFQKYEKQNYYLCLGKHKQDDEILSWVKDSYKEFPFLNSSKKA